LPPRSQVKLSGCLEGASFEDKVDERKRKTHTTDVLTLEAAAVESKGHVDRVYTHVPLSASAAGASERTLKLDIGPGLGCYDVSMSSSWPDFVVFHPGLDGKRGDKGPDFDDEGYKVMVCLEPTVAAKPVELPAGSEWTGSMLMRIGK
jgi:D-hexose-6-phosphate mutarotase